MKTKYLKELIREILENHDLHPDKDFLYRVANIESNGGEWLKQLGGGPGRGYFQYEEWVAVDVINRTDIEMPPIEQLRAQLTYDLEFQVILARKHLYTIREEIPPDLVRQAEYWKKYWNTELGKGKVQQFIAKNKGK